MKVDFWEGLLEEVVFEPLLFVLSRNAIVKEIQEIIKALSIGFGRRRRAQGDKEE